LYYADLHGANLCNAYLHDANLHGVSLCDVDLSYTNLSYADLCNANLCNADLCGANLCNANLFGAKNVPFIPMACPSEGSFIGWKKIDGFLVKLEIPEDARRSSATGVKCRCDKAKVLGITDLSDEKQVNEITNTRYEHCLYKVGEMVYPDSFDGDRWNECSHGIHFFVNKQSAIDY
jgi:hypothetical protein